MSQSLPVVAQKESYKIEVEAGKAYWWCSCGKSASQPFCDGSHKGTGLAPVKFEAEADGIVGFCGCKASAKAPRWGVSEFLCARLDQSRPPLGKAL